MHSSRATRTIYKHRRPAGPSCSHVLMLHHGLHFLLLTYRGGSTVPTSCTTLVRCMSRLPLACSPMRCLHVSKNACRNEHANVREEPHFGMLCACTLIHSADHPYYAFGRKTGKHVALTSKVEEGLDPGCLAGRNLQRGALQHAGIMRLCAWSTLQGCSYLQCTRAAPLHQHATGSTHKCTLLPVQSCACAHAKPHPFKSSSIQSTDPAPPTSAGQGIVFHTSGVRMAGET